MDSVTSFDDTLNSDTLQFGLKRALVVVTHFTLLKNQYSISLARVAKLIVSLDAIKAADKLLHVPGMFIELLNLNYE